MKLASSIGNIINPVAGPPLDDISAHPDAAWGLRKLYSPYTGAACYVYDSAGNTSDVFFDSNNEVSLNSQTISGLNLQEFSTGNGGNGTVSVGIWYDQTTGTTRNATQTTASERPLLTVGGALQGYQVTSPKASLRFIDDYFAVDSYRFPPSNDSCTILAVSATKGGTYGVISDLDGYNDGVELIYDASEWSWKIKNTDLEGTLRQRGSKAQLAIAMYDTSLGANQQTLRINAEVTGQNCTEDVHIINTDRFRIGARKLTDNQLNGWVAEGMIWDSAISEADLTSLENNIFMHYKIPKGSA